MMLLIMTMNYKELIIYALYANCLVTLQETVFSRKIFALNVDTKGI